LDKHNDPENLHILPMSSPPETFHRGIEDTNRSSNNKIDDSDIRTSNNSAMSANNYKL